MGKCTGIRIKVQNETETIEEYSQNDPILKTKNPNGYCDREWPTLFNYVFVLLIV